MSKGAKKATKSNKSAKSGDAKKRTRKPKRSFKTFISRVNKASKKGLTISGRSARILNSFCFDMFDKLAAQAGAICRQNKKQTIRANELQMAVRMLFPADLAKHCISESSKAVTAAFK